MELFIFYFFCLHLMRSRTLKNCPKKWNATTPSLSVDPPYYKGRSAASRATIWKCRERMSREREPGRQNLWPLRKPSCGKSNYEVLQALLENRHWLCGTDSSWKQIVNGYQPQDGPLHKRWLGGSSGILQCHTLVHQFEKLPKLIGSFAQHCPMYDAKQGHITTSA